MSGILQKMMRLVLILMSAIYASGLSAQETSPLFFLPGVPQASLENPAIQNQTNKLVIGLPVLSGIHLNLNSNMSFNYLFSDGFEYNFNRFYNALDDKGKAQASVSTAVFFAGIKHNRYTFSISVSERGTANGSFDREIVRLIRDGLIDFYGMEDVLGSGFLQFNHYKEVGLGVAGEMWEGFDVGIRPKLLFGKYFLNAKDFNVAVSTDAQKEALLIALEGTYFMSAPLSYDESFSANIFPGDYFFQTRNLGLAMDAGFVLKTDHGAEWSVSLLDIGAIGFRHNIFDMQMARPFIYQKADLYQSHTEKTNDWLDPHEAIKHFADSISYFLEVEDSHQRVVSSIPMRLNAAVKFPLSEKTTWGISNQFVYYKRQPVNRLSAFSNFKFGTRFEMAGILSLYNLSEITPGLGLSYNARHTQFFLASNNILGFIYPFGAKNLNLSLGMNFLFDTQ